MPLLLYIYVFCVREESKVDSTYKADILNLEKFLKSNN